MDIEILENIDGAKRARGLAVIIDVFRAFSLEAYLFGRGAAKIYAVGSEAMARELKAKNPDSVLIGERGGVILPGFDFGNSPSQTEGANVLGKTIIHTTSAGTQGLVASSGAEQVVTGALVNASAVARFIRSASPSHVSLVAMGLNGRESSPEDVLCAKVIKSDLEGTRLDFDKELEVVRNHREGKKFFNPDTQSVFPQKDFFMCTKLNVFNFVLTAKRENEEVFLMSRVDSV